MKRALVTTAAVLAFSIGAAFNAAAQSTETFMLVPNIAGQATETGFHDWIGVVSVSQNFTGVKGSACTVVITKGLDQAGPKLWAAAVTGQTLGEVKIDITRPTEGGLSLLYELVLANTVVTAISSSPSQLSEQLTLLGTGATLRYFPQAADGTPLPFVASTIACK